MQVVSKMLLWAISGLVALVAIAWVMPAISNAPHFFDYPLWYLTMMAIGGLFGGSLRLVAGKVHAKRMVAAANVDAKS